ncbi:hypothetical protein ACF1AE_12760 [Streptomyces sp. NPDC014986]
MTRPLGGSLREPFGHLSAWTAGHGEEIRTYRRAYDSRGDA